MSVQPPQSAVRQAELSYDSHILDSTKATVLPNNGQAISLTDVLKEELRSRLYLIKSRILSLTKENDEEYLLI